MANDIVLFFYYILFQNRKLDFYIDVIDLFLLSGTSLCKKSSNNRLVVNVLPFPTKYELFFLINFFNLPFHVL